MTQINSSRAQFIKVLESLPLLLLSINSQTVKLYKCARAKHEIGFELCARIVDEFLL